MKHFYILGVLGFLSLAAMRESKQSDVFERFSSINTIRGIPITAQTILTLAHKMPEAEREFVQAWLKMKPQVAAIMSAHEAFEGENPPITQDDSQVIAYIRQKLKFLKEAGCENWSVTGNVVIPVDDFVFKASGPGTRDENIKKALGMPYGARLLPKHLKEFNEHHGGATYQTASRVAYVLRGQEACSFFGLDRIEFPQKYIVTIPGRPETAADTDIVIAEKRIKNIVGYLQDDPLALDQDVIEQLTKLVGYTAIWNLIGSGKGNVAVVQNPVTGRKTVCPLDTEQPSVHNPDDFFHKNLEVYTSNVSHGWNELRNIIVGYRDKLCTSLENSHLSLDQKAFIKCLIDERVEKLLREKDELERKILAHFPKE